MPWTAEEARQHASEGGKATARKRRAAGAQNPLAAIKAELEKDWHHYLNELKAAAAGEGVYKALDPKDRMAINVRLLEWTFGRPSSRKEDKTQESKPEADEPGLRVEAV